MTSGALSVLVLIAAGLPCPQATTMGVGANPIRKVVTMLQKMQEQVTAEGKKEEATYNEFMCYCQTGKGELEASIAAGKDKIAALESSVKSNSEKEEELKASLAAHETSRTEAKDAMATATAIREKEAGIYAEFKATYETNLAALAKAIPAIQNGMGGSFLQTSAASKLKKFAMEKAEMSDNARETLLAFLSGGQGDGEGYAPAAGEILGILKQMSDTMAEELTKATADEKSAIASYESLMAAKTKEVETLQSQIEEEMMRLGELGVGGATGANDLEDTKEKLVEDTALLATLSKDCASRTAEWEVAKQLRAEELVALSDTIKVLNSDDALELFKKTLPSAGSSFLQIKVTSSEMRARALEVLRAGSRRKGAHPKISFIALALSGKQAGFEKVIGMIDAMIGTLKAEQVDDETKKAYCDKEFDLSDDKKKALELSIADSGTAMEDLEGSIAALAEEMKQMEAGIKDLDKSVDEATKLRKEENEAYKTLVAEDSMAKEVLLWAKNRLNKFYNPKLYKAPAAPELSAEDTIYTSMGGELPTELPSGIGGTGIGAAASFVQVSVQRHKAPKKEESTGVIAMIGLLVADLDKELQESKVSEDDAQADYETFMAGAKDKRATDSKALTEKGAAKAEAEEALQVETGKQDETKNNLAETEAYIAALHGECDWILKFYDMRKEARDSEIDSLDKAKAVLSGADYSFLQTGRSSTRHFRGARLH